MMKKILFWAAVAALTLVSGCGKDPVPEPEKTVSIVGAWELTSVGTKASVGDVQVSVYIDFSASGTFELYQKLGEGRYTRFSGTYSLNEGSLSGKYDGGGNWGSYDVTVSGSNLTLAASGGSEVDTYRKVDGIPSSVRENTY